MRRSFRFLTVTGIMAGLTLSAMLSVQAADTDTIKAAKSRLRDDSAYAQKAESREAREARKAEVKSWKDSTPRQRVASNQRYLGGYRAWYGDRQYFGDRFDGRKYSGDRYRTDKYSGRYYRPTNNRSFDSFREYQPGRYGVRMAMSPKCTKHMGAYSGRHSCCCTR